MRPSLLALFIVLSSLGLSPKALAGPTADVTVTYVNIAWFGLHDDEARVPTIRKFFDDNRLWADVMAFEEIVDVDLLQTEVVTNAYRCQSYHHDTANHQHVVICFKSTLALARAGDDDNYTLEDVAMTTLRPAVHGILTNARGEKLLHVIGVHLKAMPDKSAVRREQVGMISDYLTGNHDPEPAIIFGDFNSYGQDAADFAEILGRGMEPVSIREALTFKDSRYTGKFDLAYATAGRVEVLGERVVGPCNGGSAAEVAQYNRDISDHCPVNLTLRLRNY